MIFKEHESIMMCDKCYGLIKDKIGAIHLKYNNNVKLCNCKECRRSFAIDIDKNIFDIVQTLNLKGYKTSGSCEGVGHRGLYVAFDKLGNRLFGAYKKANDNEPGFVIYDNFGNQYDGIYKKIDSDKFKNAEIAKSFNESFYKK